MRTPRAYQPSHLLGILKIPNLGVGFPLRCFQRLSIPDLATLLAPGGTAARPEVSPSRSSRTIEGSPQESTPTADRRPTCLTHFLAGNLALPALPLLAGSDYIITQLQFCFRNFLKSKLGLGINV